MRNKKIFPFLPAIFQVVIGGVLAVLKRGFCLFQHFFGGQLVVCLDLGKVDSLACLNDKIRLIGTGTPYPSRIGRPRS